eukprot:2536536-Rhodomonas_salina.2
MYEPWVKTCHGWDRAAAFKHSSIPGIAAHARTQIACEGRSWSTSAIDRRLTAAMGSSALMTGSGIASSVSDIA